jgi:hypothetical protein
VYFKPILFRCPGYENIKRLLFVSFSFYDGDYSFKFYLIFWAWELFIKNNRYKFILFLYLVIDDKLKKNATIKNNETCKLIYIYI